MFFTLSRYKNQRVDALKYYFCRIIVVFVCIYGLFPFDVSHAVDTDIGEETVDSYLTEAAKLDETELRAAYAVPAFEVGENVFSTFMRTKRFEIMLAAISNKSFDKTELQEKISSILSRNTLDVEIKIKKADPMISFEKLAIQFYQNGKIIIPIKLDRDDQGDTLVVVAKFREKVLDMNGAAAMQIYPNGVRGHAPDSRFFDLDFSLLK